MKILVSIRNVDGANTVYPECEAAKTFASLCGTKTTLKQISSLLNLAYENLLSDDFDHDFVVGCVAEAKEIAEVGVAWIELLADERKRNEGVRIL